jgi:predicted HicB family RNase H-like nuclease
LLSSPLSFRLTVRAPEALATRAKIRAAQDRTTLQQLVAEALTAYLKKPTKVDES